MAVRQDPFSSAHLHYRAIEDDDEPLFRKMHLDAISDLQSMDHRPVPQGKKDTLRRMTGAKDMFLAVVICLRPSTDESQIKSSSSGTAVGVVNLRTEGERMEHHRRATMGIAILKEFQGKGYGSEAIRWAISWGFHNAGLHRVAVHAGGYNTGAVTLYSRLGLKKEGVLRSNIWFEGRWWDEHLFGILAEEWQELNRENAISNVK